MDIFAERRPAAGVGPPSQAHGGRRRGDHRGHARRLLGAYASGAAPPKASPNGAGPVSAPPRGHPAWLLTRAALSQLLTDPTVRAELQARASTRSCSPGSGRSPGSPRSRSSPSPPWPRSRGGHRRANFRAGPTGSCTIPRPGPSPRGGAGATRSRPPPAPRPWRTHTAFGSSSRRRSTSPPSWRRAAGPRWQAFLDLGLTGQMAKVADIIELQAQSLERDTVTYAAFVRAATAQASQPIPRIDRAGRAVHQPAGRAGRQPAPDLGHPGHPVGGRRLLAEHPGPGHAARPVTPRARTSRSRSCRPAIDVAGIDVAGIDVAAHDPAAVMVAGFPVGETVSRRLCAPGCG